MGRQFEHVTNCTRVARVGTRGLELWSGGTIDGTNSKY